MSIASKCNVASDGQSDIITYAMRCHGGKQQTSQPAMKHYGSFIRNAKNVRLHETV
jgi:hypothetical protein